MRLFSFISILILLLSGPGALANTKTSVFTKLDLEKDCSFGQSDDMGGSAVCTGYRSHEVHFAEGDLRQMVQFGKVDRPFDPWQSFSEFNRIHTVIEWRLDGSAPFATILRWFVENHDDEAGQPTKKTEGQVLVISTVGNTTDPNSCIVGYVDARATKNANVVAQDVADRLAPLFKCGTDIPKFHGVRGPFSGNPSVLSE